MLFEIILTNIKKKIWKNMRNFFATSFFIDKTTEYLTNKFLI